MECFKIIWSKRSLNDIETIILFYESANVSTSIKTRVELLISEVDRLAQFPFLGQKELYLEEENGDFRYVHHEHLKAIYAVHKSESAIEIIAVFDVRQNPDKLKKKDF